MDNSKRKAITKWIMVWIVAAAIVMTIVAGRPQTTNAAIVPQSEYDTEVNQTSTTTTWWLGNATTTYPTEIRTMSFYLDDGDLVGNLKVSVELFCYNVINNNSDGCTDDTVHVSDQKEVYGKGVYTFTFTYPVEVQMNKDYVVEVVGENYGAGHDTHVIVFGSSRGLQFNGQCDAVPTNAENKCILTPFFQFNYSTTTAIGSSIFGTASSTLAKIKRQSFKTCMDTFSVLSVGTWSGCFVSALLAPADDDDLAKMYAVNEKVLQIPPFSYFNEIAGDWAIGWGDAGQGTLPSLSFDLPITGPGSGRTVDLTPWNMLLGSGTILSTAQNPNTGHTIRQIVEEKWDWFIWLLFIFAFGSEIIGIGGKAVQADL